MASSQKTAAESAEETAKVSVPLSTYVPLEVATCIREDAQADDRSESYIIARVLKKHYATRIRTLAAAQTQQRRAA